MKKLNLLLFVLTFAVAGTILAQDMTPPAPIESSLLNQMTGTWVSNPYEMMGSKMTDECTQSMVLNGQFFQVNVKSVSDKGFKYEALVMIAPSKDGTVEGWSYDVFGKNAITHYTGTWRDDNIYLTGTSSWGTEIRNIAMQGDIMLQVVTFKMKDASGKEMPDQTMEIIFNKK